ncbi:hypothetical protein LNV08_09120 [Paucibacter sp. TC2R-5]|uniref:hypothetical protein n=1 Tax=Paucibacter sp. TC2R-5 TaxID=2893555 RepID=UPI0021E3D9C4|nr:hypothetical protein [Paucibacter sp. TC2R-5]MCV2359136.1 hypothetical protein [Paucibacter sp. TC2R-5]
MDRLLTAVSCQGMSVRVILADHLVRHWMVMPPLNGAQILDCQAAAEIRFQTLFGEPLTDWKMAADWQARTAFLSSALPNALLNALQAVGAQHGLLMLAIVPEFVARFNRAASALVAGNWFGVLHQDLLTLAVVEKGRLFDLRSIHVPALALTERDWLRLSVEREATRLMRPMPDGVELCGKVPTAWLQAATEPGSWACVQLAQVELPEPELEPKQLAGSLEAPDLYQLAAAGL